MDALRATVLTIALAVAGAVVAQQPTAEKPVAKAAKPAAKAAKAATKAGGSEFKLVLEPRAMELLQAMSSKLAAARAMSFTAAVSYEYPSKLGPPIVYTTRYDVTMQRPDKLRVISPGDGPASELYYDGKTMTAYAPAENLAAVAAAPPTIGAMLETAFKTAEIYYPFTDLILPDPYQVFESGTLAFVIGPSSAVAGVKTEMVAWANDDVFIQMWIGVDDKLPRRVRAVFREDPLRLRHDMELSNWQLDGAVAADAFASQPAQSAGRMVFAAPAPPPKGAKPVALGKAAK